MNFRLLLGLSLSLLARVSPSLAQQTCSIQSQAQLLPQFSDAVPTGAITPANIRNLICSALLAQQSGGAEQALSPTTSPFIYTASGTGVISVSSGEVKISRDNGGSFQSLGLTGALVPVRLNDQVKVIWTSSTIPTVLFLPS